MYKYVRSSQHGICVTVCALCNEKRIRGKLLSWEASEFLTLLTAEPQDGIKDP